MMGTHLYFVKQNSETYLKDILISLGHSSCFWLAFKVTGPSLAKKSQDCEAS